MYKIMRVLITLSTGLLAIIFSLSLLTAMTASAHSMPTAPPMIASESPPAAPLKAAGGADTFGYTYQDETEPFGPTSVFTDISGSGTALSLGDDDATNITIPFNFEFYGDISNQLRVGNNGAMIFNPTGNEKIQNPSCSLADDSNIMNVIAPWLDDWADTGEVYWQAFGTSPNRYVVVQWHQMEHFYSLPTRTATFQAILFETTNVILFN